MLQGKDLLSIHDLSVDEVAEILDFAAELKTLQKSGVEHKLLASKTLGMIFEKSSSAARGFSCRVKICNWDAASRLKIPRGFCRAILTA